MEIVGIDLGTTNSLVSVWKDGKMHIVPNSLGKFFTPSVVSINSISGEVYVGETAKERLVSDPKNTVSSFKQFMGSEKAYMLGGKRFYAEDLSAIVLKQLKKDAEEFLGHPITEAVISVPAYFNDAQRYATKMSGKLAGLNVDRIINEPSAAALAYQHKMGLDGTFLIFDFGGGTLDISIVELFENIIDIIAVTGDNHLGGDDIDNAIVEHFYKKHPSLNDKLTNEEKSTLTRLATQCKINLSKAPYSILLFNRDSDKYELVLTNDELLRICAPVFDKIRKVLKAALRDSGKNIGEIDEIILVGGSSKMPLVKEYIKHLTKKEPLVEVNPDLAVAQGIGIVAGIKNRYGDIKDMVLSDICPFTLGIAVMGRSDGVTFSPIIERNSSLPISIAQVYTTISDNQTTINTKIFQGESPNAEENLQLGELSINVPPMPKGEVKVIVRFTYDINGILEVDVHCLQNNQRAYKLIVQNKNLDQNEIDKRIAELKSIKISPKEDEENRYLLAKADRLYEESFGFMRDSIANQKDLFVYILQNSRNKTDVIKARNDFTAFLESVDNAFDDGLDDNFM